MKRNQGLISTVLLVVMASLSCAQSSAKGTNLSGPAGPELRWKYETGG
jgi:hypothetical protein